jgi:hypothetical protein
VFVVTIGTYKQPVLQCHFISFDQQLTVHKKKHVKINNSYILSEVLEVGVSTLQSG